MKILVTGATGTVGTVLVEELLRRNADVRVFTRRPDAAASVAAGVDVAVGDLLDPDSLARALHGVDALFLLNAVSPSELMEALIAYGMAKRAKLAHVTYLSVFRPEALRDVPHTASKLAVEGVLHAGDLPFTILRPNYFIQTEARLKPMLVEHGLYPVPIGDDGISAVDVRDVAEAAAVSLTEPGHAGETYDLVGPSVVSGPSNAALWSRLLGTPVRYAGTDLDAWESQMRGQAPPWMIFDIRTMFEGFASHGYAATGDAVARLSALLGHEPRSYESFATQLAAAWRGDAR